MIQFDLHTHTIVSGHAYGTLKENLDEALKKGLRAMGVSEHTTACAKDVWFGNFKVLSSGSEKIRLLAGIEANIMPGGTLDVDHPSFPYASELAELDYVIASFHWSVCPPEGLTENTDALLKTMENERVRIVGHPDDGLYPFDYPAVVEASKQTGTVLEINNASLKYTSRKNSRENIVRILELCGEMNVPVCLGSDAHIWHETGDVSLCEALIESVGFPKSLVLNYDESNLDLLCATRGR